MDVKAAALIWAEMVSAGVVPLNQEMISMAKQAQIEKIVSNLSEDDKRRLKRKFRKLWRKLRYKNGRRVTHYNRLREGEPTASQMRRRKQAVFQKFYREALEAIKKVDPTYGAYPW
jgi:Ni/Co efflux regulator RcnB